MEVRVEVSVKFEDLEKILNRIDILTEHIDDIKTMAAPLLGFKIKKKESKEE